MTSGNQVLVYPPCRLIPPLPFHPFHASISILPCRNHLVEAHEEGTHNQSLSPWCHRLIWLPAMIIGLQKGGVVGEGGGGGFPTEIKTRCRGERFVGRRIELPD